MKKLVLAIYLALPLTGVCAPPATTTRPVVIDVNGNMLPAVTVRPGAGQIWIHGADVASASTVNLTTATGDLIDITGTATINAITLAEGMSRTVRFTGAGTITHGAALVLPGQANITRAAGDFAVFRSYGGVVRCTSYSKINGTPIVGGGGDVFLAGANVFTNTNIIDTGSNGSSSVSGLSLRNDTASTSPTPAQNAPAILFEGHAWHDDGEGDFGDDKWEIKQAPIVTPNLNTSSRISLQFSKNGAGFVEKEYFDSDGTIGAQNGNFVTFRTTGGSTSYRDAIGTTVTAGITLLNSTAAAAGFQQMSPSLDWTGKVWGMDAGHGSQDVSFRAYVLPVQDTSDPGDDPYVEWRLDGALNGDWLNVMRATNLGIVTINGALVFGSDPADVGRIRLDNTAIIAWEAATPGTDVTLTVNSSNNVVASAPIVSPNFISYTTTATAAGTTTLTVASTRDQFFTGATTQTVTLPVTSTLTLGHNYRIVNNSSGTVTVNSSGGNAVLTLTGGTQGLVTCILTSGTSAASWSSAQISAVPYLVYTALLTQSDADAPVATPLPGNTIGAIVWTYVGVGDYLGTLTGAFGASLLNTPPIWGIANGSSDPPRTWKVEYINPDTIALKTYREGNPFDGQLANVFIEVRVYP